MYKLLLLVALLFTSLAAGFAQEDKGQALLEAVQANNLQEVKRLVEAGAPIETRDDWNTPLTLALEKDFRSIAQYLMDKGASAEMGTHTVYRLCLKNDPKWIEKVVEYGFRTGDALIPAAENGYLEVVKVLIEHDASPNVIEKRRCGFLCKEYVGPIELALKNNHDAVVVYLMDHGASLETVLHYALLYNKNAICKQVIDRGGDLNRFFLDAIAGSNKEIAQYTLMKGANRFATDSEGKNALLLSIERGNDAMVNYTMDELKLDPNATTLNKENALMLACKSGNVTLFKQLLDRSVTLEHANLNGETVVFYALRSDKPEMLSLLLDKKVAVNHVSSSGTTPLMLAAANRDYSVVMRLLELGADVSITDINGKNALSYLVEKYGTSVNQPLLELLVSKGLSINSCGTDGETLVFKAAEAENLELLQYLRSKGADFNPINNAHQRPAVKNALVIRYLIDNGADINAVDDWHSTYMCTALSLNDLELAAYLVKKGINLEQACYFEENALIKAVEEHNMTFVRYLTENGANVNAIGYFDKNVMEYAIEKGTPEIVTYLRSKGAMTPDERKVAIVEEMQEIATLNTLVTEKKTMEVLSLLKKYPKLTLSPTELKSLALLSAESTSVELLRILLESYQFDLNTPLNFEEQTILFKAAEKGNIEFVTLLLSKGADPGKKDAFGKTADEYASGKEVKKRIREYNK